MTKKTSEIKSSSSLEVLIALARHSHGSITPRVFVMAIFTQILLQTSSFGTVMVEFILSHSEQVFLIAVNTYLSFLAFAYYILSCGMWV
ncbi:hypothetical protein [Dapis sp. BLCC M229]|uniref:hypothetical protein n=1 Tax=Dapis sp. BLCC M229 TaxID=3400188 RepID=UPI003CF96768